jgi:hypothetical protein
MELGQVYRLNDLETEAQLLASLYRATPSGKMEIEDDYGSRTARNPTIRCP